MLVSPKSFFLFAGEYTDLLVDLFHHPEGLTDGELLDLIHRHLAGAGDARQNILDRLLKLGFIEPAPEATSRYELTRVVQNLIGHLLHEQRLSSAAVVQGYLDDLAALSGELEGALLRRGRSTAERALSDIATQLERIRSDSRANRDSITQEVLRLKANRENRSAVARWEAVNRIWERYLVPLRELIEVGQAMDTCLDRLGRLLEQGHELFATEPELVQLFVRQRARLRRMRREVADDHRESMSEVAPLYQSLRRDTRLLRGAAEAIDAFSRGGPSALPLDPGFTLSVFRLDGLIHDGTLESYLTGIIGYRERAPSGPILPPEPPTPPFIIESAELNARLAAALPVDDVLAWLFLNYSAAPPAELLRGFALVLANSEAGLEATDRSEETYEAGPVVFQAHPVRAVCA